MWACHVLDSIKSIIEMVIGSSDCLFSLKKSAGIALKNLFQQKDQMWYQYCVAIYFYPIWHKCQSVQFYHKESPGLLNSQRIITDWFVCAWVVTKDELPSVALFEQLCEVSYTMFGLAQETFWSWNVKRLN